METKLRLIHEDGGYDLLREEDMPKGTESLGTYDVETRDGTETRHKVDLEHITSTDITLPDGYEATPVALMHLVQTLTDRHSTQDRITAVQVLEGDAKLGARIAALLDAEVMEVQA